MNLPRMSLGAKLLGMAGALCALTLVVTLVAISSMSSIAADGHRGYEKSTLALDALGTARGTFNLNRALAFKHILEPDAAKKGAVADLIHANDAQIAKGLDGLAPTLVTARGRVLYRALRADIVRYDAGRERLLALSAQGERERAYAYATDKVTPIGNRITAGFDGLQKTKLTVAAAADRAATDHDHHARTLVLALLAFALALGAGLALALTRSITRRVAIVVEQSRLIHTRGLGNIQSAFEALARGDLTLKLQAGSTPLAAQGGDEIADLMEVINEQRTRIIEVYGTYEETRGRLSHLIGDVAQTAGTVSSASQQMAATSEEAGRAVGEIANAVGEVAHGSQKQVMGIDDARRLTDEVAQATTRSADDAAATAQAAEEARRLAAEGAAAVGDATEAMGSVRSGSAQATAAIRALGEKSEAIGGIVDTIGGIAEQTNLLALNAAIEAARAGEQGRGFAVVAEEVRKLAEESQPAARDIGGLIGEIQAETGRAVQVVEDGAARTEQGAATVQQARDAFERIGGSVDDVTARVAQIAASVQEIAASAQRMGERMTEIAAVAEQSSASTEEVSASTEQTSASTQEIAASAQELALSASHLHELVGRFTLDVAPA
jgi:methyl-accepting chemotaxis protein